MRNVASPCVMFPFLLHHRKYHAHSDVEVVRDLCKELVPQSIDLCNHLKSLGAKKENGNDREAKSLHEHPIMPLVPTVISDNLSDDRQLVVMESVSKSRSLRRVV
jgi:hypothetical protein